MIDRRGFLAGSALAAGWMMTATSPLAFAADDEPAGLLKRPIPVSNEMIPVIGMGTSGSFEVGTSAAERDPLHDVMKRFFMGGARVIDTAPSYGTAEVVVGDLLAALKLRQRAFVVTKLGADSRSAGEAQFAQSLQRLRTDKVDALLVHNLRDWKTQLAYARELKEQGKTRYVGLTHYLDSSHEQLAKLMQSEKPDIIQINYSVASPKARDRVLPLAKDLGIAVMINRAFDDGRLFAKVGDKALPGWAGQAGVTSWAQMFLKFAISHPAVTVVIPATGKPDRQSDNLKAGTGNLLTDEQCNELIQQFA